MRLSFLQISDLHYLKDPGRAGAPFSRAFAAMDPPLEQLRSLLKRLDRKPDFVLITGDLVHNGEREDYVGLKAGLDELLGVPYYVTAGNHDDPALVREIFLSGGGLSYVRELPGARLICLNSGARGFPDGRVDLDALALLARAGERGKPTFVFTHHHLLSDQFVLPPAQGSAELLAALRDCGARAVLCGHTHHYYQASVGPVPYYTADSLSFSAENERDGTLSLYQNSGATLFTLEEETLSAQPIKLSPARLLCRVKL